MRRCGTCTNCVNEAQESSADSLFLPGRVYAKEINHACLWQIGFFYMESSDPAANERSDDLTSSPNDENIPVAGGMRPMNSLFGYTTPRGGGGKPSLPEERKLGNIFRGCLSKGTSSDGMKRKWRRIGIQ
jgi:hypothetical protein